MIQLFLSFALSNSVITLKLKHDTNADLLEFIFHQSSWLISSSLDNSLAAVPENVVQIK